MPRCEKPQFALNVVIQDALFQHGGDVTHDDAGLCIILKEGCESVDVLRVRGQEFQRRVQYLSRGTTVVEHIAKPAFIFDPKRTSTNRFTKYLQRRDFIDATIAGLTRRFGNAGQGAESFGQAAREGDFELWGIRLQRRHSISS